MKEIEIQAHPIPRPRRSASADAALRAEIRRVEAMTVEERMRAALALGKGFSGIERERIINHPD